MGQQNIPTYGTTEYSLVVFGDQVNIGKIRLWVKRI